MTTTQFTAELRENTKRQAKRLGKSLDLPHNTARDILARSYYRCESWDDLEGRINSKHPDERVMQLASLPDSAEARSYFSENIDQLARSLSRRMLVNSNLMGLYDTLNYVFGVKQEPVAIEDLVVPLPTSAWLSAGIGPDPNAVLKSFTVINNVPIMLLATRVYMPKYYSFGESVTIEPACAEPYGERLKIIWSGLGDWLDAARAYLMAQGEDDAEHVDYPVLPSPALDAAMAAHEEWFSRQSDSWPQECSYGDHNEDFLPILMPNEGTYLVFGFPADLSADVAPLSASTSLLVDGDTENDNTLVLVDGQPVCIERISVSRTTRKHVGPYTDYFDSILRGVFSHSECNLDLFEHSGWEQGYFFIRPASWFDVEQFLRVGNEPEPGNEVFVLLTDHPTLAAVILDKVFAREVMTFSTKQQNGKYIVVVDVTEHDNFQGVRISLDLQGADGYWSRTNFVTSCVTVKTGTRTILYAIIHPEFLVLTGLIQKRSLRDALQYGIVLRRPSGFYKQLERPPKRCFNFTPAPQSIVDHIDRLLKFGDASRPLSLKSQVKLTRYYRDNY